MIGHQIFKIDDIIDKYIKAEKIQGAVVAISRHNRPVYFSARGFSNLDTKEPLSRESMFHMASSTKPVLGVAAMIAMEHGLFRPEDTVEKYIPSFKGIRVAVLEEPRDREISPTWVLDMKSPDNRSNGIIKRFLLRIYSYLTNNYFYIPAHRTVPAQRPITIHDLLTHTSGLGGMGLGTAISGWSWSKINPSLRSGETLSSFIEKVSEGPLDFQPGTRWSYSATIGLDVIARIIEITSKEPFNEFVQQNIFAPLDMKDTHWDVPPNKLHRVMVIRNDKGGLGNSDSTYFSGSMGLVSTARDYLHFEQMLVNGGSLFGKRILDRSSVRLMSSNQIDNLYEQSPKGPKGEGFGYTVSVTLDPSKASLPRSRGSFGWSGVTGTISWSEPARGLAVVVLVQQANWDMNREISEAINSAIIE